MNAGTYAVAVNFTSADNNYNNASGSGSILINKADSTTVVSVAGGVTFHLRRESASGNGFSHRSRRTEPDT